MFVFVLVILSMFLEIRTLVSSVYIGCLPGMRVSLQRLVSSHKILYLAMNVHYYMELLAEKQSAEVNKYKGSWEIYFQFGNVIGKG